MLFDSNILIACLEAEPTAVSFLLANKKQLQPLFVSTISVAKILSLKNLSKDEIRRINNFIDEFVVLPFDRRIAEMAGEIRRAYRFPLPDAVLAATAQLHNLPLITRDKGFSKIKEITARSI